MAEIVDRSPGADPHTAGYYADGYPSVGAFLAETKRFDIRLFEPNPAVSIDHGSIGCTQAERRLGKRGLFKWIFQTLGEQPVDYFEFGVQSCKTFNRVIEWTASRAARFYGFDTFEGLPQPWVRARADGSLWLGRDAGELKAENAPAVYDARATLFKGLFHETLPEALQLAFPAGRAPGRPLFVNIDSDLYSSALYALTSIHPLLRTGDHVYFDEFFDAMNEFSAFNDYVRSYGSKSWFIPIARAYDGILFRIELPAIPAIEVIDRRSTGFLERMKAYARTRVSLLKQNDPGRP